MKNKKHAGILLTIFMLASTMVYADEGMWLLNLLQQKKYQEMKEKGLQLSPEEIYSVNHSSLKDAIVLFGRGCTGEVISDQGLILTNMHCGYGQMQAHTTPENNYLEKGFWSGSKSEELPNPGLSVKFLQRIKDVTKDITGELTKDMDEEERQNKVNRLKMQIARKAKDGNNLDAQVKSFYGGNQYYLLTYKTYKDVRLVASPPTSIGDFGSLTDNWMYPRHKADFMMFRVYMSPDGEPAEYDPDNVPYKPKHHLPISLKGAGKGDFSMILGYPYNTDRYMTSYGIQELKKTEHPNRIKIRGAKLDVIKNTMEKSPEFRIMYAAKYKGTSNYWKYSIGQMEGFERQNLVEQRQEKEKKFRSWVSAKKEREAIYGEALPLLKKAYSNRAPYVNAKQYIVENFLRGPYILNFARSIHNQVNNNGVNPGDEAVISEGEKFFKDFHKPTDKKIAVALFNIFRKDIKPGNYPEGFAKSLKKRGGVKDMVNHIYNNSIFADQERFMDWTQSGKKRKLKKDPAVKLALAAMQKYRSIDKKASEYDMMLQRGHRLFVDGLMKMQTDKTFYPDANGTMRLTYGTVNGYAPKDAVYYKYYTTLEGVMEKEDPDNYEFKVTDRLKKLYKEKAYGRYGENGEMHVCYITNNDITGGNSGSPVLNGKGELTGLAFDSNWEGMTGDIEFEEGMQKTVITDIRYILWILDKYANAGHLVEEMDLVDE